MWRLGKDILGLLLHQNGHILDVPAPEVQTILHAFDLEQIGKA